MKELCTCGLYLCFIPMAGVTLGHLQIFAGQTYAFGRSQPRQCAIAKYGVTHFCAAPVVLNTIVNTSPEDTILPLPHGVNVMTTGAAPAQSVLFAMFQKGFHVTHTYGHSETYGPSTVCVWKPEWNSLTPEIQARLNARQGVRYIGLEFLDVINT